jgi:hypothetical protein
MKPLGLGRRGCWFGLLFVLTLPAGCGGSQGTVSGQVLFHGKPLPGGRVIFRPDDSSKNTVTAQLDENGRYEATLPAGAVKIAVDNRELRRLPSAPRPALPPGVTLPPPSKSGAGSPAPPPENTPPKLPGNYIPIPPRYCDVDASGLTYTVKPGTQSYDIELK